MKFINTLALFYILSNTVSFAAETNRVHLTSKLDPNAITITEVDVIFLYDEALIEEFPATKTKWYSMRRTLTRSWGDSMDIVSIFIPQAFDSETASLPQRRGEAVKVYIIAQHDDPIAAPNDVTTMENVSVVIDGFGIIVSEEK